MATLTPEQLHVLQHTLGANEYGRWPAGHDSYYRNHYVGASATCDGLVALGLMEQSKRTSELTGGEVVYRATEAGIGAVVMQSPRPPRLTRGQERYQRSLSWKDSYGGRFRDFLAYEKERCC
jgi:hypothetical protein